jgi:glycerol 3-phosphatase-2
VLGPDSCHDHEVADEQTILQQYDALLLDLDGVVYVGQHAVPRAAETVADAAANGRSIRYVTNNASRTPQQVADHLSELGLPTTAAQVITSAQAGARLATEQVPAGSSVLAVGGPGVAAALAEVGLQPIPAGNDDPGAERIEVAAVVQGFGRQVGWGALARASFAVASGVPWIATNIDRTIPIEGGIAPGNGMLVAAVAEATGRSPQVAGKPYPAILQLAAEQAGGAAPLVVGDRLDTDIQGAVAADLPVAMVLTGVSGALDLWRAPAEQRPTYLMADLAGLNRPPLAVQRDHDGYRCGDATARLVADQLEVSGPRVAATWAAAQLLWDLGQDGELGSEPTNLVALAQQLDSAASAG